MRARLVLSLVLGLGSAPYAVRFGTRAAVLPSQEAPSGGIEVDNSGYPLERGACLTVALGPATAAQCGSLRITHPLPSIRTLNKLRTPTLIYNSEFAHPYTAVPVYIRESSTTTTPVSVEVDLQLQVNGVYQSRVVQTWPGTEWPANQTTTRRVTVVDDALASALGMSRTTLFKQLHVHGVSLRTERASLEHRIPTGSRTLGSA